MVCTQQMDFSAALSIQSMFLVNIAVAYLSEEKSIPESFVTDLRAAGSNCDTVAPIQWDPVCEDLAGGFLVDCTGSKYVEEEEEATNQRKRTVSPQNPPPPKVNRQAGGRHTRQGQKIKGWSKPLTAEPQAWIEPSTQQGVGHVCSPLHTVPTNTEWCGATVIANKEMPADHAPQGNGGHFTGKVAKPKARGLRKRR